jgi:hypothetical protein
MSAYEHLLFPVAEGRRVNPDRRLFGKVSYLVARPFTCWHRKLSRPITRDGETYRACLRCGMHRQFDLREWKSKGGYYNPKLKGYET